VPPAGNCIGVQPSPSTATSVRPTRGRTPAGATVSGAIYAGASRRNSRPESLPPSTAHSRPASRRAPRYAAACDTPPAGSTPTTGKSGSGTPVLGWQLGRVHLVPSRSSRARALPRLIVEKSLPVVLPRPADVRAPCACRTRLVRIATTVRPQSRARTLCTIVSRVGLRDAESLHQPLVARPAPNGFDRRNLCREWCRRLRFESMRRIFKVCAEILTATADRLPHPPRRSRGKIIRPGPSRSPPPLWL